jgi:hypothetical protein
MDSTIIIEKRHYFSCIWNYDANGNVFSLAERKLPLGFKIVSVLTELEKVDYYNHLQMDLKLFRKKNLNQYSQPILFCRTCNCNEYCFNDKCRNSLGDQFHLLEETSSCKTDMMLLYLHIGACQ